MLIKPKSRGERGDSSACLELIKSGKESVRVNLLDVAKALLKVCKESQLEVITRITKRGYRTYVVLSSADDIVRCYELLKSLLAVYLPGSVRVSESQCDEVHRRYSPF